MTNKPREFWVRDSIIRSAFSLNSHYICWGEKHRDLNFDGQIHVIEAAPALEKINRLEAALQKCKEQRDWFISELYEGHNEEEIEALTKRENARLKSILEGR